VTTDSDVRRIDDGDDSYWNDLVFAGRIEGRGEEVEGG